MELASNPASPSSIPLYLINGVATVWDAQVAATLHCVHGISGLRAGTLPGVASQNVFLGLPITLMQEETAWLVLQGIAHLVPLPSHPHVALTPEADVEAYNAARQARIRTQQQRQRAIDEQKSREGKAKYAAAGEAARAKREARAKAKAEKERARRIAEGEQVDEVEQNAAAVEYEVLGGAESAPVVKHDPPADGRPSDSTPAQSLEPIAGTHFHTIPPTPFFPPSASPGSGLAITSIPHPLFPFPSTSRDRALVSTFAHLHARGLRVGLGPRFGGEYLVYPGDYLRYHAHFTSQVIVDDEPITPGQVVAWGRLGTGTKKAGLLCCWTPPEKCAPDDLEAEAGDGGDHAQVDADLGEVEFYSLEWASFG